MAIFVAGFLGFANKQRVEVIVGFYARVNLAQKGRALMRPSNGVAVVCGLAVRKVAFALLALRFELRPEFGDGLLFGVRFRRRRIEIGQRRKVCNPTVSGVLVADGKRGDVGFFVAHVVSPVVVCG